MQVLGKVLLCCQRHRSLMTSGTHMRTYCQRDGLYHNNYPQDSPHWAHLSLLVNKWGGGAVYSILLPIVFSLPQRSQSSHLHGAPLHLPARRVINQGESLWQKRAPLALHICTRPRMNGGGGYYGRAGDIRLHNGVGGYRGSYPSLLALEYKKLRKVCSLTQQTDTHCIYQMYTYGPQPHPNPSSLPNRRLGFCVASNQLVAWISTCSQWRLFMITKTLWVFRIAMIFFYGFPALLQPFKLPLRGH